MPFGSQLVSTIAAIGMFRRRASLMRDVFLVGVDHEQQVGQAAHLLDAAERAVELFLLARERQALLLGVAGRASPVLEHLLELAQPLDRGRDRLPVGQRAAEPARIDVILRASASRRRRSRPAPAAWCRRTGCGRPWRPYRSPPARRGASSAPSGRDRGCGCCCGPRRCTRPSSDSSGGTDARNVRQLPKAGAWNSQEAPYVFSG